MQKVVALGGGHGLAATLSALRQLTNEITAVVTVADNGGSSGRLREEFPILPPLSSHLRDFNSGPLDIRFKKSWS